MDIKEKYNKRLKAELEGKVNADFGDFQSSDEYKSFVDEIKDVKKTLYETACYYSDKYIGIEPDKKTAEKITSSCKFANLQLTPKGVYSFGLVAPLLFILIFGMASFLLFESPFFLFMLIMFGGLGAIMPLFQMPTFLSDKFRLKASGQMVLSIFYLVTYMRHTSNLERAIEFAAAYLNKPLSTEFRKVLWDVEAGSFETIEESLENMINKWREYNPEFVDAIHLIESSLQEGSNGRRLELLDKSLDVILDETYEKMLHFAHNLQSPITTLHMLGIILPILGLVILPLALSFLDDIKWYHISVLYNIFLPIIVYILGLRILSRRPSGYGETPLNESNKEIQKALRTNIILFGFDTKIPPKLFLIFGIFFSLLLGFSPLLMHSFGVNDFGVGEELELESCGKQYCFLGYREVEANNQDGFTEVGPYGLGAALMSLVLILGVGLTLGIYYSSKSSALKKVFDKSKQLENEFSSALFQLGNRLGDNLPAEIAIYKVTQSLPNTAAGDFFKIVSVNIQKLGLSVQNAIFDSSVGAIIYYPSQLIESSMKVLIQAVKKGPLIASNALINISRYVKEMHKVEERLQDLMAEVISSMKSQISFLTPIIAAIVVGITSMISTIIGNLNASLGSFGENVPDGSAAQLDMVSEFFKAAMPTYYFQLIVGIYVLQITFILTILVNAIKNGSDKVEEQYLLGTGLTKSILLYTAATAAVMIVFNVVTLAIMPAL